MIFLISLDLPDHQKINLKIITYNYFCTDEPNTQEGTETIITTSKP